MKVNSHNEWDNLKEIIVGRAEGRAPLIIPPSQPVPVENLEKAEALARQASPQWLEDEIGEDLEGLCDVLKSFGVTIHRPPTEHNNRVFATPYFSESPSQEQYRYFETVGLYDIWYE